MAQRQQYETLPGKDISEKEMSGTKGGPVVLSQPTKLSATEEYVLNLDPNEVAGKWRSVTATLLVCHWWKKYAAVLEPAIRPNNDIR